MNKREAQKKPINRHDLIRVRSLLLDFSIRISFAFIHDWRWYCNLIACWTRGVIQSASQCDTICNIQKLYMFISGFFFTSWHESGFSTASFVTRKWPVLRFSQNSTQYNIGREEKVYILANALLAFIKTATPWFEPCKAEAMKFVQGLVYFKAVQYLL